MQKMKNVLGLAVALALVAFLGVDANAGTVTSRFDVDLGGYVKLDYIHQDANLGPLSAPVPADGTQKASQDQSLFTARQTRVHLKVTGPDFLGAKTTAFIEGDFYGQGGSNETSNFRMRHAYGALAWKDTQVLFGQFWDIFGPCVASTLDFRSGQFTGAPNNPRVPQVRLTHNFRFDDNNSLRAMIGAQNPVENFQSDNTSGDMVNIAGQAMLVSKALGVSPGYWGIPMQPLTVGLFGLFGQEEIEGNDDIDVYGYGLYAFVPILKSSDGKSRAMTLSLETQGYIAAGLNIQGATAASTVGTPPNQDAAKGYGVFAQFIFYPIDPFGITFGYGRRNILDSSDYSGAAEQYNEQYFTNVAYDLNAAVRVAAEYQRLNTKYLADPTGATDDKGDANRFMVSAMYFF
jgi:hypothetical protein